MKKKRQTAKLPVAQFLAIIVLSISVFLIVDLGRRAAANYRIQREAERLSQEVEAVKRYQAKLLAERTYAASDLYVEEVARQELKWTKPSETVVVVLPIYEKALLPAHQPKEIPNFPLIAKSPQQAWWNLFFGPHHPANGSG